jgi:predicted lipoprotein with Yx(FWY)xxD motif
MSRLFAALLLVAVVAAGCGDDQSESPAADAAPAAATPEPAQADAAAPRDREPREARRGKRVRLVDSQFGDIVGDGRGQAFYVFDRERSGRSECYGDCARAWPPVLTRGRPTAGKGVRSRLLATTRRRGGKRQVTYRGQPLYYYVDDSPGNVLCHDVREFGGLWLVIRGDGEPVG